MGSSGVFSGIPPALSSKIDQDFFLGFLNEFRHSLEVLSGIDQGVPSGNAAFEDSFCRNSLSNTFLDSSKSSC